MGENVETFRMGWIPDYPDIRDYTPEQDNVKDTLKSIGQKDSVKTLLTKVGVTETRKAPALSASVDLRPYCPPVENQLNLGSCTANAGVGLIEYYEKRAFGTYTDASRLFLYKVTRKLLGWTGDTGAYLRTTMSSLVLFGAPPEKYWPYNVPDFDVDPSAFMYAFAGNYKAIQYFRLDPPGTARNTLLTRIKIYLSAGLPSMFGFTVYNSYGQASSTGKIPFPAPGDRAIGGHAIVAVGYDDNIKIKNTNPRAVETTDALLFRNSWGTGWGMGGYGYLPYEYVLKTQAVDWWSLIKSDWVATGQFGI